MNTGPDDESQDWSSTEYDSDNRHSGKEEKDNLTLNRMGSNLSRESITMNALPVRRSMRISVGSNKIRNPDVEYQYGYTFD